MLDDVIRAETPTIRRATFYYGDETVGADIWPNNGIDALFAPRRTVLDRVLVDGARNEGVHVRHGAVLTGLEHGPDDRVVGASIRDQAGVRHAVRAGIVIGADGRHSTVAALIGARKYRVSEYRTGLIYGYFSGLRNEGFRWYYRPGVSVGVIPTNEGDTCVFVSLPPERFGREISKGAGAVFDAVLAETSTDLAAELGREARRLGGGAWCFR